MSNLYIKYVLSLCGSLCQIANYDCEMLHDTVNGSFSASVKTIHTVTLRVKLSLAGDFWDRYKCHWLKLLGNCRVIWNDVCVTSSLSTSEDHLLGSPCNSMLCGALSHYAAIGYFGQYKIMHKIWKMTETLAHGYLSETTQWELSNEYQHDRV